MGDVGAESVLDGIAVDFASVRPFGSPKRTIPRPLEKHFERKMFLKPSFRSPSKKSHPSPPEDIIDLTHSDEESDRISARPARSEDTATNEPPVEAAQPTRGEGSFEVSEVPWPMPTHFFNPRHADLDQSRKTRPISGSSAKDRSQESQQQEADTTEPIKQSAQDKANPFAAWNMESFEKASESTAPQLSKLGKG